MLEVNPLCTHQLSFFDDWFDELQCSDASSSKNYENIIFNTQFETSREYKNLLFNTSFTMDEKYNELQQNNFYRVGSKEYIPTKRIIFKGIE